MRQEGRKARAAGRRISFVPTMGALHEGHIALFRAAKSQGDLRVVSIFVNPTQFNSKGDFINYPRTLETDFDRCRREGIDILFVPGEREIYPHGPVTDIPLPRAALPMEGEFRPGHFAGVCAVVDRLFRIVQPQTAIFGEKDYQQLRVIQEMVVERKTPVGVVPHPTVRDKNGLALSSRNARLSPAGYEKALAIPRVIRAAQELFKKGGRNTDRIVANVGAQLTRFAGASARRVAPLQGEIKLDYLTIADAETLEPLQAINRPARIFLAAWVEGVRLIDNDAL